MFLQAFISQLSASLACRTLHPLIISCCMQLQSQHSGLTKQQNKPLSGLQPALMPMPPSLTGHPQETCKHSVLGSPGMQKMLHLSIRQVTPFLLLAP